MSKYRSLVLPVAVVLGLIFHHFLADYNFLVPYLIFSILLLNFVSVDVKKLHFSWMDAWLMLFQIVVSLGSYLLLKAFHVSDIVAEGVMVGVLCPVAASVVVIACLLGANRETVTTYTIWGNMMVAVVAPIYFSFIGLQQDMPFLESFWMILKRISPVIVFPFFLALFLQYTMPKVNAFLDKYRGISFYLWACAFLLVMGKTFEFISIHGKGNEKYIVILGIVSILFCAIQFAVGKWLGSKYGDRVAGGQLLGQKNTAFGIWLANCYLNPLASVYVAFYAIWQNLFNSWQLWRHDRQMRLKAESPHTRA